MHMQNAARKMGVGGQVAMICWAIRHGLLTIELAPVERRRQGEIRELAPSQEPG